MDLTDQRRVIRRQRSKKRVGEGDKFGWACHMLLRVSCFTYISNLKMEAVCSSEALDSIRHYNPE
jgi:hypothetical protein